MLAFLLAHLPAHVRLAIPDGFTADVDPLDT
jgi:hypothetical protein